MRPRQGSPHSPRAGSKRWHLAVTTRNIWGWPVGPMAWSLARCRVPYAAFGSVAVAVYTGVRPPRDLDVILRAGATTEKRMRDAIDVLVRRHGLQAGAGLVLRDGQFDDHV